MAKKESAKRGYMTKDEIAKHLEGRSDKQSIRYLEGVLEKRRLLAPQTQRSAYQTLGEIYEREGQPIKASNMYRYAGENIRGQRLFEETMSKRGYGRDRYRGKVSAVITIAGILAGLFFLSPNITGDVVANMTNSTSSFLGVGLLIIGLIAGLFWMTKKPY